MSRKTVSVMLGFLLVSALILEFNIQPAKASGTIYIRADGSIDPPTAAITTTDNVTYTFTDDIYGAIVVERDNIVVDGAGYKLLGTGSGTGVSLIKRSNVTVRNLNIMYFNEGIGAWSSSWYDRSHRITIVANNISNNFYGIRIRMSDDNSTIVNNNISCSVGMSIASFTNFSIVGNVVTNGGPTISVSGSSHGSIANNYITASIGYGIYLGSSSYNTISNNYVSGGNMYGIWLESSTDNGIFYNKITDNGRDGLELYNYASNNIVAGNDITENGWSGIRLEFSSYNRIYHNNVVNNGQQVFFGAGNIGNLWDYGYPSGGNYWSDYTGVDEKSGPNQDQPGSDGIGDTPYVIDANNTDRYPLMAPFSMFNAGTWNGLIYNINVVSNSTVSGFYFNPDDGAFLRFNISGQDGATGFCRVTIPKDLLWAENGWTVYVGDKPVNYTIIPDNDYTYLYFTYNHSTKTVQIQGDHVVSELPSNILLLLLMSLTLLAVAIAKKRHSRKATA